MRRSETQLLDIVYRRSTTIRRRRRVVGGTCVAAVVALAMALPGAGSESADEVDTVNRPTTPTTAPPPEPEAQLESTGDGVPAGESAAIGAPPTTARGERSGAPAPTGEAAPPVPGVTGQIAFTDFDGNVWVVNADGTDLRRLAAGSRGVPPIARWSPDGTTILFLSGDALPQLTTIRADGSGRRELTTVPRAAADPRWSPDGRQIAYLSLPRTPEPYSSYSPLRPVGVGWTDDTELAVIGTEGSSERLLTATREIEFAPIWSPDGQRIAFFRFGLGFHTIGADGSDDRLVWDWQGEWISWSPDGGWWAAAPGYENEDRSDDRVVLVRPDGSEVRDLVRALGADLPVWSPTGDAVAFLQLQADGGAVRIVGLDGRDRATVLDRGLREVPPSWSPDGRYVIYCTGEGLFRVGADGSAPTLIATGGCLAPEWSPR